ncbi:hypothetical protein SAMN04515656_10310 [Eubacterium aggregans]|uniref:Uncharacterized protein n=1 Tax=Eubacterium aggregans TaxID=81409 RepID=A0A1H3Y049_9FIRM|nr:hypothetical protein [Eubacterium aggregans]SEA05069.1 hypothetical protein SAMN04515656_10310 [Eubacterium aggregans]
MKICNVFECPDNTCGLNNACCCECDRADDCANLCDYLNLNDECQWEEED